MSSDLIHQELTTPRHSSITKDEARMRTESIRASVLNIREHLYVMFNARGWEALGYSSWHEYLTTEFETNHTYLRRQTYAAAIEADLGIEIGTHKESHLRPLAEILGDDRELQKDAILIAHGQGHDPTAKDFYRIACETYIWRYGADRIDERFNSGEIGAVTAYKIQKFIESCGSDESDLIFVAQEVSDPDLLPLFRRLKDNNSNTWWEIVSSLTIPSFPEPVMLADATVNTLLAWLDIASTEHIAIASLKRKAYYAARDRAIDRILESVENLINTKTSEAFADLSAALLEYKSIEAQKDAPPTTGEME